MAENLDDGEFWLPPQFLTDDDDDNSNLAAKNNDVSRSLFLSSSSETESDEEDQLAELTRRVALGLDLNTSAKPKDVFGGGSPQSTLSAFGSSGKGSSPNGAVPPHANTWDLLREAAGEVQRMQLNGDNSNDRCGYNFPKSNGVIGLGFYPQALSQQQFQIAQFEMMRKQQMAKQQQQRQMVPPHNRGRNNNNNNVNVNVVGMGLSASAWHPPSPPPPPPHGSGMRGVFLAGKRESAGTGVFLPRSVHSRNNNNESRKKPGCNTVYVPDRVVQALHLNSKGVVVGGHLQQQHKPRFNGETGSAVSRVKYNNNNNNNNNHYGYSHSHHQKRNNLKPQHQPLVVNHEIHLPQEWTY